MRGDRGARRALFCGLMLGLCSLGAAHAQEQQSALSDWSGWWGLNKSVIDEWEAAPPPLSAEDLARFRSARREDSAPVPNRYCRPPQFTGYSGGYSETIEFLFTPGRVTLTSEEGMIRRIYTDGRTLPADPVATNTGTSVGRWEGQTLLVETVGINPRALFPLYRTMGAMPIGEGAKITERIWLQDPDTLVFEVETVAPEILTAPDTRVRTYVREPAKTTALEVTFCAENDRAIDPVTGEQRFDMTPPADMAPPPAQ